jgi:hypothetical protein
MSIIVPVEGQSLEDLVRRIVAEVNGQLDYQNVKKMAAARILASGSIGSDLLGTDSVGSDEIAADSVGSSELTTLVDLTKPVVSSLPGSPTDGEVIFFQSSGMATDGIVWTLKYRAASGSAYKWEYIGGSDLQAVVDTDQAVNSTTYAALATAGPSITVPLAGDYDVAVGCFIYGTAGDGAFMSYDVGGTGAIDADAAIENHSATLTDGASVTNHRRKTALAASTALVSKYRGSTVSNQQFSRRWMRVRPVRVG